MVITKPGITFNLLTRCLPETIKLCEKAIVFLQTLSNALKFSKEQTAALITISSNIAKGEKLMYEEPAVAAGKLMQEKLYCHIKIADNGIGFDPQYSERIFEVFQRLHGKDEYTGTGIGLSIVKKIVENHNGIIVATGILGVGATFDIYIPEV